jgi:flagellar basal-body rod protein FlgB
MGTYRGFLDTTAAVLAKAASATLLRQEVISANIANAETPGYQPMKVEFEDALFAALREEKRRVAEGMGGDPSNAVENVEPRVTVSVPRNTRWDANGVNAEEEMAALAEATLQHEAVVRLLAQKFRMLQIAINGAGR